ncbi:hypothetical protein C2S53_009003 [Perilla frutescens var. hirtella]|uniref:Transposase MuDR plant domain-containing protein n=1 Tax=Perilla frutescens var. hirtella TaxID=608512 RepID=A0AAD4IWB0_PERFH|nr:hypothetical protein C2S53_009003 [Perilla frutescens var. hirtella]
MVNVREKQIHVLEDNKFKLLSSDDKVREACVSALGVRQVVFYVEEGGIETGAGECDVDYDVVIDEVLEESAPELYSQNKDGSLGSIFIPVQKVVSSDGSTSNEGKEDDESEDDSDYNMVEETESDDDMLFDNGEESEVDVDVVETEFHEYKNSDGEESEVDVDVVETEFHEYKNSDGEYERPPHVFNYVAIFHPDFSFGMIFSSKDQFKKAVQSHAINNKRSVKFTKNAPDRCYARCVDEDCPWKINLTKMKDEDTFHIREFVGTHECDTTFHVKNMKSSIKKQPQ